MQLFEHSVADSSVQYSTNIEYATFTSRPQIRTVRPRNTIDRSGLLDGTTFTRTYGVAASGSNFRFMHPLLMRFIVTGSHICVQQLSSGSLHTPVAPHVCDT